MLSVVSSCVLEHCSSVWCSAADTHLKLQDRLVSGTSFQTGECLSVTCSSSICGTAVYAVSGVSRCTLLMVLYLFRMCQSGLHKMLGSHVGILMRLLAAEPRRTGVLLFPSQCPCGTMLLTLYSMVWDRTLSIAGPTLFLFA